MWVAWVPRLVASIIGWDLCQVASLNVSGETPFELDDTSSQWERL